MRQNTTVQAAPAIPQASIEAGRKTEQLTASYMTHELRAPLTSINLTLEILREQLEDRLQSDEKQLLNLALKNAGRLAGLINDIMDFAKIQAGKLAVHAETTAPVRLVTEAVEALQTWSASKGVWLFCSCEATLLPDVMADARRVVQVLTNLISNAIKFTPSGGRIEVAAQPGRRENAGSVVFSVKDSGCGISAGDFERVFRSFEQSASGVKSGEGTGLGLTLAKSMVEAHGGRIWLESTQGIGSTFYFTIPLAALSGATA